MISPEIRASQLAYQARPFAVRWIDSHGSGTHRFDSLDEAYEYIQAQWARVQRDVAQWRYRASCVCVCVCVAVASWRPQKGLYKSRISC